MNNKQCNDPDHNAINAERGESRGLRTAWVALDDKRQELEQQLTAALRERNEARRALRHMREANGPLRELKDMLKDQLKAKQVENNELCAMLGYIVDWSPELPFYSKDKCKVLFTDALSAARELLSKCKAKDREEEAK